MDEFLVFATSANRALVEDLVDQLNREPTHGWCRLAEMEQMFHADGEPFVEILDNVRGRRCIVIGNVANNGAHSVNDHALELFVLLDALKRASARIEMLVLPYLPYARQDRRKGRATDRTAITAHLFAQLVMASAKIDRVCVVEPHDARIESFFTCPFDRVPVIHRFVDPVRKLYTDTNAICVMSPDRGGIDRASAFASMLRTPRSVAWVEKRRYGPGQAKAMKLNGKVRDCDVVLIDDMVDTAGTLEESIGLIKDRGARRIIVCCVHGLFNKDALARIDRSPIERVITTSSLEHRPCVREHPLIDILPLGPLLAEATHRIVVGESLRSLGKL